MVLLNRNQNRTRFLMPSDTTCLAEKETCQLSAMQLSSWQVFKMVCRQQRILKLVDLRHVSRPIRAVSCRASRPPSTLDYQAQ